MFQYAKHFIVVSMLGKSQDCTPLLVLKNFMQISFLNWVSCRHNEKCPIPSDLTMLKMTIPLQSFVSYLVSLCL